MFRDVVTELNRRAALTAGTGRRSWDPAPDQPALVIIVDEYAEMPEEAHGHADSVARLGRAVAVGSIAAAQPASPWAKARSAPKWISGYACGSENAATWT